MSRSAYRQPAGLSAHRIDHLLRSSRTLPGGTEPMKTDADTLTISRQELGRLLRESASEAKPGSTERLHLTAR